MARKPATNTGENSAPRTLSASEALFAFMGWLTSRDRIVTFSARHDAAPAVELVQAFCKEYRLFMPVDGWDGLLHQMPDVPIGELPVSNDGSVATIPAGTLIHIAGVPFRLTQDTRFEGSEESLHFALEALLAAQGPTGATEASSHSSDSTRIEKFFETLVSQPRPTLIVVKVAGIIRLRIANHDQSDAIECLVVGNELSVVGGL